MPVAAALLPGPPREHPGLLSGQRHPVARALDRESRYWLVLQVRTPLLRDESLQLLEGDMLLMETDAAWTSRLDLVEGRLCGVCVRTVAADPVYAVGKFCRDAGGSFLDTGDKVFRLAESLPSSSRSAAPHAEPIARVKTIIGGKRRTIRPLEEEEKKARRKSEVQQQEQAGETPANDAGTSPGGSKEYAASVFALRDVVAVCVYLVRPSPWHLEKEGADFPL